MPISIAAIIDFVRLVKEVMALANLGSQKGDRPTTPTLRQYAKKNGNAPNHSHVKTIFKPNKLPYYTLITDHDFKVVVSEDNPLHGVITDNLEQWAKNGQVLVVVVENGDKGFWSLSEDTDDSGEWEERDWGFSIGGYGAKKATRKKTHT